MRSQLNLEAKVDRLVINAKYWEWMKRYRVWEANRKIFLYPENWLGPSSAGKNHSDPFCRAAVRITVGCGGLCIKPTLAKRKREALLKQFEE
jgi:hypothetical protein